MKDKPVIGKVVFGGKHTPELVMPDLDCTYCTEKDNRIAELKEELEEVMNEALSVGGYPESTPNASGQPVSTEPRPRDVVAWLASRNAELQAKLDRVRGLPEKWRSGWSNHSVGQFIHRCANELQSALGDEE